jgi:hypothetical protein
LERWVLRLDGEGQQVARRKSPKRGTVEQLFAELIRIPTLALLPNFALEVLLVREEQVLRDDGAGSWRRKGWSIADRRLLDVVDRRIFVGREDYAALLPPTLPDSFTSADLSAALKQPRPLMQKMLYCLRTMDMLRIAGKQGRAIRYQRTG